MQATLNGVCANNSVCVLAKKCISRFTHLLWIFARAQGWVGHLSDLYRCEYVKPCTNVNIKKIKQTKMGSWADFVKCTTPLFISFFRNCSHLCSLPVAMNVPVAKRPQRRGGGLPLVCSQGTYDPLRTPGGTPGNSWWGCAARFSKSWPYLRSKNVIFNTRFQTRPLKSIPVFRPGL